MKLFDLMLDFRPRQRMILNFPLMINKVMQVSNIFLIIGRPKLQIDKIEWGSDNEFTGQPVENQYIWQRPWNIMMYNDISLTSSAAEP